MKKLLIETGFEFLTLNAKELDKIRETLDPNKAGSVHKDEIVKFLSA